MFLVNNLTVIYPLLHVFRRLTFPEIVLYITLVQTKKRKNYILFKTRCHFKPPGCHSSALINCPTDETEEEWTQLYPSFSIIAYIPRNSGASPFSDIILPAAVVAAAAEWNRARICISRGNA